MMRATTVAAVLLVACSGEYRSSGCLPNETQTCLCPGGGSGIQTCNEAGDGWSPCDCGAVDAVTDGDGTECVSSGECSNGLVCDGEEVCDEGTCRSGEALDCDDVDDCTVDECDEDEEGCVHAEVDGDGDGYVPASCGGTDCDDARFDVHPEALDLACDSVDNDCDTVLDVLDDDDDGFVDVECEGDDCNDELAGVNPSGSEDTQEACRDAEDNDCDTLVDCDDTDCPSCNDTTGTYSLYPFPVLSCWGGGDVYIIGMDFEDDGTTLDVSTTFAFLCTMTGPSPWFTRTIDVSCSAPFPILTGCSIALHLAGMFSTDDQWTATLTATFTGTGCSTCGLEIWTLAGQR